METMKTCKQCSCEYPENQFRSSKYKTKSGVEKVAVSNQCRLCRKKELNLWKKRNREKVNESARERYRADRDRLLAKSRERFKKIYSDPIAHAELKKKRSEYQSLHPEYRRSRKTPESCYKRYKQSSVTRGLEFSLNMQLFIDNWCGDCWYCGDKLETIGWDRIDDSVGYTDENVRLCCKKCNFMKSSTSEKDFLIRVIKISKLHGN